MTGNPEAEELKVGITKAIVLSAYGHYRYYTPKYDMAIHNKNNKPAMPIFAVNCDSDKYPIIELRTERDLCWFIFRNYGAGTYRVIAWAKGKRYPWSFWRGEINADGFCFERYNRPWSREINRLRKLLKKTYNVEEREDIKNELIKIKQLPGSEAPIRKPGFIPYIKPSSRRGEFIGWEDSDIPYDYLDDDSRNELWFAELDRKDKEESDAHFKEVENKLREWNPKLFED